MKYIKPIDRQNDIIHAYYITKQTLKRLKQGRPNIPYWFATALHVMSQYENGATFFMTQIISHDNLEKWLSARRTFDLRDHTKSFSYNRSPNPDLCYEIMDKLERTLGIGGGFMMIFEDRLSMLEICKSMKLSK